MKAMGKGWLVKIGNKIYPDTLSQIGPNHSAHKYMDMGPIKRWNWFKENWGAEVVQATLTIEVEE